MLKSEWQRKGSYHLEGTRAREGGEHIRGNRGGVGKGVGGGLWVMFPRPSGIMSVLRTMRLHGGTSSRLSRSKSVLGTWDGVAIGLLQPAGVMLWASTAPSQLRFVVL